MTNVCLGPDPNSHTNPAFELFTLHAPGGAKLLTLSGCTANEMQQPLLGPMAPPNRCSVAQLQGRGTSAPLEELAAIVKPTRRLLTRGPFVRRRSPSCVGDRAFRIGMGMGKTMRYLRMLLKYWADLA